jgi:hypothetical protein
VEKSTAVTEPAPGKTIKAARFSLAAFSSIEQK